MKTFACILACAVVLSCLALSAESKCTGLFSPFVPLPTANFDYRQMDTCCWYADNTCCGIHDELFDLQSIQDGIDDLASRGLSDACFIKLSSMLCFWCDPNTVNWLSPPSRTVNPTSLLLMCDSFCNELFIKCFDDLPLLVNDLSELNSAPEFCEHIILDNFHNDDDDVFPDVRIEVVPDVGNGSCFGGVDDDEVEREGGVCLPTNESGASSFEPLVYLTINTATGVQLSVLLIAIAVALFMI